MEFETDPTLTFAEVAEPLSVTEREPFTNPSTFSGFSLLTFRLYFDVTTTQFTKRLFAAATPTTDEFFTLLHAPDLYGAIWVPSTVAFLEFVLGHLTDRYHSYPPLAYNFKALVSGFFWLMVFVFGAPFLIQNRVRETGVLNLMSLFGYSTVYIIPPSLVCLLIGTTFGFIVVFAGAIIGAYSISIKTGASALPRPAVGRDELPFFLNATGLLYLAVHFIVHFACFGLGRRQ
jgi:hypothetical protein